MLGTILVDVDLAAALARSEAYTLAYHRYLDDAGHEIDMVVGLRYVDRFERRDDEWRIKTRVCAYDWRRTDPVVGNSSFSDTYTRGLRDLDDIVWHILD